MSGEFSSDGIAGTREHRSGSTTVFASPKLNAAHLQRRAIVYVRQSTPHQVAEHQESTARQYALVERAVAMGWPRDRIEVIDDDQGMSGRSAQERLGFQRLLAEVGLDRVGLILGLEMSRLARSCRDWHQLLELCAIFYTLLGDQDGLYDPTEFNDRLLLGLKGTMSEAELHVLKGRMFQGRMNKADRGELTTLAPIGYVRSADGTQYELDPDEQAQSVVRMVFSEFRRHGTIYGLVRYLNRHEIRVPVRAITGPERGKIQWRRANRNTLREMLRHPIYAGAYRYGYRHYDPRRKKSGRPKSGRVTIQLEECRVLIRDRVPAYISWDEFESNRKQLDHNRSRPKGKSTPRCGPSLLAGLLRCGRCGKTLKTIYSGRSARLRYSCCRGLESYADPVCISMVGKDLDDFVAERVLKILEPASLEICLSAAEEIDEERARLDKQWQHRLERAAIASDRASRQYQAVEPENRLVARTLEANWEKALGELEDLREQYQDWRETKSPDLNQQQREMIRNIGNDFPSLWYAPSTCHQDRQEILRMLIDCIEVDIEGSSEVTRLKITWAGGFESFHEFHRTIMRSEQLANFDQLIERSTELRRGGLNLAETAARLNQEGYRTARGRPFNAAKVCELLVSRGIHLKPGERSGERDQLREHEWWLGNLASELNVPRTTLLQWCKRQWINSRRLPGEKGRWILWADACELERLRQLRNSVVSSPVDGSRYPAKLTTPAAKATW
jgi:DNA invertase Pin-like site-specific DNA recombinase/ribosomal protein S27AE